MRLALNAAAAAAVVAASLLNFAGTAAAHERRDLGQYQFVVGWLDEPAYVGLVNSLDLRVTDVRANKPVAGLEKTLTVDVQTGGIAPLPLTITARFGQAGAYNAYAMPTKAGVYTFHIKGKVEAMDIDEKFESGPGRFGDIEPTTALQYPAKVPGPSEVGDQLNAIRSDLGQIRILAAVAIALGVIAIAAPFLLRRRA